MALGACLELYLPCLFKTYLFQSGTFYGNSESDVEFKPLLCGFGTANRTRSLRLMLKSWNSPLKHRRVKLWDLWSSIAESN